MTNLPLALLRVGKTISDRPTTPTSKQEMFLNLDDGSLFAPTDIMTWQQISGGGGLWPITITDNRTIEVNEQIVICEQIITTGFLTINGLQRII